MQYTRAPAICSGYHPKPTPYCQHCSETPLSQCHFVPHESHADFVRLLSDYLTMISKLIIVQRDATQSSLFIILQVHSTCFGCRPHPSSGVHKTVTGHIFCAVTSLQRGQASLATLEGGSCTVPEAVVAVLCTPDDGRG